MKTAIAIGLLACAAFSGAHADTLRYQLNSCLEDARIGVPGYTEESCKKSYIDARVASDKAADEMRAKGRESLRKIEQYKQDAINKRKQEERDREAQADRMIEEIGRMEASAPVAPEFTYNPRTKVISKDGYELKGNGRDQIVWNKDVQLRMNWGDPTSSVKVSKSWDDRVFPTDGYFHIHFPSGVMTDVNRYADIVEVLGYKTGVNSIHVYDDGKLIGTITREMFSNLMY